MFMHARLHNIDPPSRAKLLHFLIQFHLIAQGSGLSIHKDRAAKRRKALRIIFPTLKSRHEQIVFDFWYQDFDLLCLYRSRPQADRRSYQVYSSGVAVRFFSPLFPGIANLKWTFPYSPDVSAYALHFSFASSSETLFCHGG